MDFTRVFDFVGVIPGYVKYVAALIFVLMLILLVSWVLKKINAKVRIGNRGGGRLKVHESIMVDTRRTLTLVSCDNVEHLILLGETSDLVVAADIQNSQPTARSSAATDAVVPTVRAPEAQPAAAAPVQSAPQVTPVATPVRSAPQAVLAATAVRSAPQDAPAAVPVRSTHQDAPITPRDTPPQQSDNPAPRAPQSTAYRRPRKTTVQPLAKPAPRARPAASPSNPGRRDPEPRPHSTRPPQPARSEPSQLNGEEGVHREEAETSSFSDIRPGDEK